jgi:hypothetical protein
MIAKTITYREFEKAIRVAFDDDADVYKLYDPKVPVQNVDDIIRDIVLKVRTYENAVYKGVFEKDKLIGYYVYEDNSLVSFGLNIQYRVRNYLREFFGIIKKELTKPFFCVLHSRNVRAVKFLLKHGCSVNNTNPLQTQLIYK